MADLYSVHELCEALDVSRGTFYNHIFRRVDRSKYEEEKTQLMLKVKQIFDDSEQRYGADKIRAVLAENGLRISAKRVLSIMHELGLYSIRTDAKKLYKEYRTGHQIQFAHYVLHSGQSSRWFLTYSQG